MKKNLFIPILKTILFLLFIKLNAQSKIPGNWEGNLSAGTTNLNIIIHIKEEAGIFKSLMDVPKQGAVNLAFDNTIIQGDSIKLINDKARIKIYGLYNSSKDTLFATYTQAGNVLPLVLSRSDKKEFIINRPQTPKAPFPYSKEDVYFVNKNAGNIKLAGTLTIPKDIKNPPVVILVAGSGTQNRNSKAFDHELFLILSDYLSRRGIAVLRYDKRGIGESQGDYKNATSYDFSLDTEAAIEFLKSRNDININKLGLIGHSEGGMIVPMVAARNTYVKYIVIMAGPGVSLDKLMLNQIDNLSQESNDSPESKKEFLGLNAEVFNLMKTTGDEKELENKIREALKQHNYANGDEKSINNFTNRCISPWFRYFINYNPASALEKVKCPVLAINGELDKQVDAKMNLDGIRTALSAGKNQDFVVICMPGLNHAFQEAKTGHVSEYKLIEQTMSPKAMDVVVEWIKKRF